MKKEILIRHNINIEKGVARCLGDEKIYAQILKMFLDDDTFARTKDAYNCRDLSRIFRCAHELKGVSGNAELTTLYEAVCPLVEFAREKNVDEIDKCFLRVEAAYTYVCDGIREAFDENNN